MDKNSKKIVLFVAIFLIAICSEWTLLGRETNGNGDFQFWLQERLNPQIGEVELYIEAEQRWGESRPTLYLHYLQFNLGFKIKEWLYQNNMKNSSCLDVEVAPGYRQTFFRVLPTHRWDQVDEPMAFAILRYQCKTWEISCRHQVQYRIFKQNPNLWLYRIRPQILLGKCCLGIQSYLFDELFFTEKIGFNENRAGFGLRIVLIKHLTNNLEFFYKSLWSEERWLRQAVFRFNSTLKF